MVREKAKFNDDNKPQTKSSSLRETKRSEQDDLAVAANSTTTVVVPSVTTKGPQKRCAPCHFSCLRCHGPNDYDCTDCAPDSSLRILINNQGTCEDLPVDKAAQAADLLLVRLTSDEIILIAACLSAITFIMAVGAYFFFRNICCDYKSNGNKYQYNALDDEEKLRLTYSHESAVAYKREVDSIINDESSSISGSDDDDDYENVNRADVDEYRRGGRSQGNRQDNLIGLGGDNYDDDDDDEDEDVYTASRSRTRNF